MRKLFVFLMVLPLLFSCQKSEEPAAVSRGEEIKFSLGGLELETSTKATEVTTANLTSVYWQANSGASPVHSVASYTVPSSKTVSTGKYWPSGGATYTYYVANVTFNSTTKAITATNATDIVCGTQAGVTNNACTVNLDHIFARTATLTLNTQDGYTLSNVSWRIKSASDDSKSGTAGTYTIGGGWAATATTPLAETALGTTPSASGSSFVSTSDMYLIPAKYTVYVTFTLTKGEYTETFTKHGDVTLVQGSKNSITGIANGGSASGITFNVSVTAWNTNTLTPTLVS